MPEKFDRGENDERGVHLEQNREVYSVEGAVAVILSFPSPQIHDVGRRRCGCQPIQRLASTSTGN